MDLEKFLRQQLLIIESLDLLPFGKIRFGSKAGGVVDVEIENPIGKRRSIRARCGSDCPPGKVQLIKLDTGEYVAFSPSASREQTVSPSMTRTSFKKQKLIKKEDGEFWPVTSVFLYSKIKPNQELLDDNGAAMGDETSWDCTRCFSSPTSSIDSGYVFFQRFDRLGDYSKDAFLLNKLKPDRLITPSGGANWTAARDNLAWGAGAEEARIVWYYIGNPADAFAGGQIFKVSGLPMHPNAGNVTENGPGLCMEVYNQGEISAAIFPKDKIGKEPLTKALSLQFPGLGGSIGYAGRIERWRGMADYTTEEGTYYFRNSPDANETFQIPTSTPSWYVPGPNNNPWLYTNGTFFQFGWPAPAYVGAASSSWILAVKSAIDAVNCGAGIANDKWYWGGDAAPNYGRLDWDNTQGQIATEGIYVCWMGHKDNEGLAESFFEAFRTYWGIAGSVTRLGAANPYGCEIPNSGGGFPPRPPNDSARYIGQSWGRKAEMWLKICRQDDEPIDFKLPFEYAAVVEKRTILGGGSFGFGTNFEAGKTKNAIETYGAFYNGGGSIGADPFGLENPHATLSIDTEFAYVTISYGCERIFEEPLVMPVRPRLGNLGYGGVNANNNWELRAMGSAWDYTAHTSGTTVTNPPTMPVIIKDCFTSCWFYKIKLPTKDDKTVSIVESKKYMRGEVLDLAIKDPNKEFNEKFLIHDFRTSASPLFVNFSTPRFTPANTEFATFGGLPALNQFVALDPQNISNFQQKFYKNKSDWTAQDWIYYQLTDSPRQINGFLTVLPSGVFFSNNYSAVLFDSDKKFGRHGRSEIAMPVTAFGSTSANPNNSYENGATWTAIYPVILPFTEQLIGNGVIQNGSITKWYRVSPSSFPIFGQSKRNP